MKNYRGVERPDDFRFRARRAGVDEEKYLTAACRAADFIRAELWDENERGLRRHWMNGAANVPGSPPITRFSRRALLDLFEASFDNQISVVGRSAHTLVNGRFFDKTAGGYFDAEPSPDILVRLKEDYDGAEPSPSSVAASVNLRLSHCLMWKNSVSKAWQPCTPFPPSCSRFPSRFPA
jgi:uncharacterized protein YyaL (SSP411 family)